MTTRTPDKSSHDSRSLSVVSALVSEGLVEPARREEAMSLVDRSLTGRAEPGTTLRHRLAELAGYVGGAFVAAAVVLFLAEQWDSLSTGEQVGLLAGVAALLAVAGVALGLTGGGLGALRSDEQPVRRRLAGVLFSGAAAIAAGAVGVQVDSLVRGGPEPALAAALTALVLGVIGYVLAPTLLGQAVIAFGAVFAVPQALDALGIEEPVEWGGPNLVGFGLGVLAIGLVWVVLAERAVWYEVLSARVIGSGIALAGAQIPLESTRFAWVAYVLTTLVAVTGFTMYVARRAWPYLALGVVAVTIVVPEALLDWFEGVMGPAGVLLVAGVTLLGASLLGLRLRKEVAEQHGHAG